VIYLAELLVCVTTCFRIFRIYAQNVHWLRRDATADSSIYDQLINITALIHGLDVF